MFDGNYTTYLDSMRRQCGPVSPKPDEIDSKGKISTESSQRRDSAPTQIESAPAKRKRKHPYRKVHDLEADIAATEERLAKLQADLATPEVFRDGQRAKETTQQYEAARATLAQLYDHWEEAVELN